LTCCPKLRFNYKYDYLDHLLIRSLLIYCVLNLFQPEVDVLLSVNEPLIDESQQNNSNLVTITMESLFSLPDSWTVTGSQYAYATALPLPLNAEVKYSVSIHPDNHFCKRKILKAQI